MYSNFTVKFSSYLAMKMVPENTLSLNGSHSPGIVASKWTYSWESKRCSIWTINSSFFKKQRKKNTAFIQLCNQSRQPLVGPTNCLEQNKNCTSENCRFSSNFSSNQNFFSSNQEVFSRQNSIICRFCCCYLCFFFLHFFLWHLLVSNFRFNNIFGVTKAMI